MALLALEHSRAAYAADFVLYGVAVSLLSGLLVWRAPTGTWPMLGVMAAAGLLSWTLIEYLLHRFVLHGLQPFKRWHAEHHARPTALICAPTLLSAVLFFMLVFLPAFELGNLWVACALTLGVVSGYLAYAITHHAVHHWRGNSPWLKNRKQWHALHHARAAQPGRYGVSSGFWDRVSGTG
ncbi:MAG: sterol desaturase family protein [Polaromonas sp.]|nr:sterol desaturase family protein [Polaromonas sp.]